MSTLLFSDGTALHTDVSASADITSARASSNEGAPQHCRNLTREMMLIFEQHAVMRSHALATRGRAGIERAAASWLSNGPAGTTAGISALRDPPPQPVRQRVLASQVVPLPPIEWLQLQ